jgi:hypothetical protein
MTAEADTADEFRRHHERIEQLLARIDEALRNLTDVVSELVPDQRRQQ